MHNFLKSFSGLPATMPFLRQQRDNKLMPDTPFYAVGDVHGCVALLEDLLGQIGLFGDEPIVFLGDYIDRGPDACATLDKLYTLALDRPEKVICLMGNHERMMLDFIDDPLGSGASWLRCGGRETLESFGIKSDARPSTEATLNLCAAFEAVISKDVVHWLRNLPLSWKNGNMQCVHAAMDPSKSPQRQKEQTLLWGHPAFMDVPRADDICVVHAHTVVSKPTNQNSRIALDTGAHRTGRLTAAFIDHQTCRFIAT